MTIVTGAVPGLTRTEVEEIRKLAECHPTGLESLRRSPDGNLRLTVRVAGNGLNVLAIEPETAR